MSIASVEELRVHCPPWCVADHDSEAPGGWLPPNGDAVLHASAPFALISEPTNALDVLRVTVAQRQVHPDRDRDGATEVFIDGCITLSSRQDVHTLIAALQAAQALLAT
jgi:hypothetical protein